MAETGNSGNDVLNPENGGLRAFAERLQTPLWVFDIERGAMVWANPAAIRLWNAPDLDELRARDFAADMSESVRRRLAGYLQRFAAGQTVTESWTFFPKDRPVTALCRCSGYDLPDGRVAMLVEATELDAIDAPTLRSLEALRQTAVCISVYDSELVVLSRNPAAANAFSAVKTLSDEFVDAELFARVWGWLQRHESAEVEAELQTAAGPRWFTLDLRRMPDPETGVPMVVVSGIDITERRDALAALEESEQRLREISDVLADGVYVLDAAGAVTFINPAGAEMLGWEPEALMGRDAHATFHHSRPDGSMFPHSQCPALQAVEHGKTYRTHEDYFFRRDGAMFPVASAAAPLRRDGRVIGAVTAFRDISESKAAEAAVVASRRSLANAQRIAHIGNWDWDIGAGRIYWSDETYRIFGFEPQSFTPTYEAFFERVQPQERADLQAAVEAALRGEAAYRIEHRVVRPDGETRVVFEAGEVVRDEHGQPLQMIGTVQDITERKQFETALETAQERLGALIANLRGAVLVEDENRRIVLVNQAFCDLFAVPAPPDALTGADCAAAAEQSKGLFADPEGFIAGVERILSAREAVKVEELVLADGRVVERDYLPVFIHGEYRGHLWQYWDVTERKEAEREMRRLATTDPLTDLPNRRYTLERLAQELLRLDRGGASAAVLLLDLDHFKVVNDRFGHGAGDEALRRFAQVLRQGLRRIDLAGRIGGEEFLVLLPETDGNGAMETAERLRRSVEQTAVESAGTRFWLSVSVGVALLEEPREPVSQVLARADEGLYSAKSAGRNCVRAGPAPAAKAG